MSEEGTPLVADLKPDGILTHVLPEHLETLKFYGTFGEYAPGEVVVQEGTEQDNLYYVVSGKLDVVINSSSGEVVLGSIGGGDCIGEISIFEPGPASATVRVTEPSILWQIDVSNLQQFFERLPVAGGQVMLGVAQLLSKRLRQANQAILANRMLPKHLSVRSGGSKPITAETVGASEKPQKSGGIFSDLFKKKGDDNDRPSISTQIKM